MADRPERPGFRFPGPPPKEALDYFRGRALWPGFSFRDVWHYEHAYAFTVAKAMEMDLLKDIRSEIDKAIAEGRTLRQFQKDLTPILQKKGWWGRKAMTDPKTGKVVQAQLGSPRRLRTIYQSNLRAARAAGQWDRAQRTKKTHPYFLYELGPSKEHRDQHRAWAGTLLPVDDPWWDDHFPPNGWGCKCRVRQVSKAEAERRGGPTPRPPRNARTMTNRRTGMRFEVDQGLDPAWASNPGKFRGQTLMEHLRGKIESDPATGRVVMEQVYGGPLFQGLRERPFTSLPAGFLGDRTRRALGAENPLVEFPEEIVHKQEGRWKTKKKQEKGGHPDLTPEDYRLLPRLIEYPQVVMRYQPARPISKEELALRLNLISEVDGVSYNAVVGRMKDDPAKVALITFHKIDGGREWVEQKIEKAATGEHGQRVFRNRLPPRKRDGAAPGSPTGSLDGIRQPPHGTKPLP